MQFLKDKKWTLRTSYAMVTHLKVFGDRIIHEINNDIIAYKSVDQIFLFSFLGGDYVEFRKLNYKYCIIMFAEYKSKCKLSTACIY